MYKINDQAQARKDTSTPEIKSEQTHIKTSRRLRLTYLLDACIIVVMGVILFWGVSTQFSNRYNDATRYQCYAISFWQGKAGLHALGLDANAKSQCAFLANSASSTL